MTAPHAVIIAGGAGERLGGVRKAELRIGGTRQIDRVVAALGLVTRPIMVASGPAGRRIALPHDCQAVADLPAPCGGPLAGLAAAVAQLAESGVQEGLLVSSAVDVPFLPADFVERLTNELGSRAAAFAGWADSFYPPNAVWQLAALQTLPAAVMAGEAPASLKALQRDLGACRIDWPAFSPDPFANGNMLHELLALQRRARW